MPSLVAQRSVLKTAPTAEPISTAEAKLHLRVTQSADNDYIDRLVKSARQTVEAWTGRALINQTWYLYLDAFPWSDDRIRLPKAPLSSITSLIYTDTAGTATTWDGAYWDADTNPTPGELVKTYGSTWPTASLRPNSPIVIEYIAGYGAAGSAVPEPMRDAIYLMIGDAYMHHESQVTGTIVNTVRSIAAALDNFIVEAV